MIEAVVTLKYRVRADNEEALGKYMEALTNDWATDWGERLFEAMDAPGMGVHVLTQEVERTLSQPYQEPATS
ncbi:MAG: hypothetical protein Q8R28_15090 [Dehalococcoidia bacterium]|nr:hypothetical protein [Dehalococcoidia bacterium]